MKTMLMLVTTTAALAVLSGQEPDESNPTTIRRVGYISGDIDDVSPWSGLWPGGLIAIRCNGLRFRAPSFRPTRFPLPYSVWGISVEVGLGGDEPGLRAPIVALNELAGGEQQITVQIPWEYVRFKPTLLRTVNPGPQGISVSQGNTRAVYEDDHLRGVASLRNVDGWEVFLLDRNGYILAQHARDGTWVTPENPARAGETLLLRATNLGRVVNPPKTGYPTPVQIPLLWEDRYVPGDSPQLSNPGAEMGAWAVGGGGLDADYKFPTPYGRVALLPGGLSQYTMSVTLPAPFTPKEPYRFQINNTLCPYEQPPASASPFCLQRNFTSSGAFPIYVESRP